MLPWSFTPLTKKIVTADLLLRTAFKNVSCRFCCFSLMGMPTCCAPHPLRALDSSIVGFAAFAKGASGACPRHLRAWWHCAHKAPGCVLSPVPLFPRPRVFHRLRSPGRCLL